jgi:hypothetical protein
MVTQQIPKLDPDQPVADQLDTLMLGFVVVTMAWIPIWWSPWLVWDTSI